ncbi:hypothetical protein [Streptomyces fagopyri]
MALHGTRPGVDRGFGLGADEVREACRSHESGTAFGEVVMRVN